MTKQEFINQYAKNSGLSPEQAKRFGLDAEPCDCDYEDCQGWQAVFCPPHKLKRLNLTIQPESEDEDGT